MKSLFTAAILGLAGNIAVALAQLPPSTSITEGTSVTFAFSPIKGLPFIGALEGDALLSEMQLNVAPLGFVHLSKSPQEKATASIFGAVRNNAGQDVCGLVLANGQFMFSCAPTGAYSLVPTLDGNGQITIFGFADGHFPFKTTAGALGGRYDITLNVATGGGGAGGGGGGGTTTTSISFTITDACHDGYGVNYRFYDETNNLVWPSSSQVYFTTFDDTPYRTDLSCRVGAKVCYGARNTNPFGGYWGVDIDNSKSCADCCIQCQSGGSISYRLTC